ncbi:hypothetical protein B0G93_106179 [Bacillus sp. V-88]|nr:hypothetical protein B0G93_106179 [Bacillus sp. V-88]SLK21490.1 hypothetical protein SAMN06295884_106179 [Bacillus sp. V-88]
MLSMFNVQRKVLKVATVLKYYNFIGNDGFNEIVNRETSINTKVFCGFKP